MTTRPCCITFLASLALLAGCSSTFHTAAFSEGDWRIDGDRVQGVVFYLPQRVITRFQFETLVSEGAVIGRAADGTCMPVVEKEEIKLEPDLKRPRVLINQPALFSSGKLSATFENGMLASINTESTPKAPEFIKEAGASSWLSARLDQSAIGGNKVPACNAGAVIASRRVVSD